MAIISDTLRDPGYPMMRIKEVENCHVFISIQNYEYPKPYKKIYTMKTINKRNIINHIYNNNCVPNILSTTNFGLTINYFDFGLLNNIITSLKTSQYDKNG